MLWPNDDGSAYFSTSNLGCPSWSGAQYIGSINTINPNHVAYARNGVGIQRTAIGTPEIFYTDFPQIIEPTEGPLGHYIDQSNLRNVSQCLPVMTANPIRCRPGGNVNYEISNPEKAKYEEALFKFSVDAGGCKFDQYNQQDPAGTFGAMASRFCPTNNTIGRGTVAMGASGVVSLTLAASMGDKAFISKHAASYEAIRANLIQNLTYAVSCDVDIAPTIKWRTLTLELRQGNLTTTPSYSKIISGVDGCDAMTDKKANWTLGNGYAGGAAAALVPPLSEGRYWNGMTNTIFNSALNITDTSDRYATVESWMQLIRSREVAGFGFGDSSNALEDVLGLTTGITMGQMSTMDSMHGTSPMHDTVDFRAPAKGKATFACTRVGSGNRNAVLFTLPPLLSMLVAVYLLFTVPKEPTTFKTSRLDDLIAIGMATERELSHAYKTDHMNNSQVTYRGTIPRAPHPDNPFNDDIGGEKAMGLQELRAVHQKKAWD